MLREDGFVLDDGTCARIAEDRYFITTSTANAGRVYQHMQFCHQVLRPDHDVQFVSVTDQWAQYSVAGPRSRDTLAKIVDVPFGIANSDFPHMGAADVTVCGGIAARLYRLSYSGELAYEIGVPARFGHALASRLIEVGASYGIAPYGTEALGVMRIEKGHVAGPEIDGRTTAADLGFAKMMSTKKDFIGKIMAGRPALTAPDRPKLTGLRPCDTRDRLYAGAPLLPKGAPHAVENDQGVVTSVTFSPSLNHWVGIGLLSNGPQRIGETMQMVDLLRDAVVDVEVCSPVFVDQKGERPLV
jgi:sarcosine oxidase subunit alpha